MHVDLYLTKKLYTVSFMISSQMSTMPTIKRYKNCIKCTFPVYSLARGTVSRREPRHLRHSFINWGFGDQLDNSQNKSVCSRPQVRPNLKETSWGQRQSTRRYRQESFIFRTCQSRVDLEQTSSNLVIFST